MAAHTQNGSFKNLCGELETKLQVIPKGGFPTEDMPPSAAPSPVKVALYGEDKQVGLEDPFLDNRAEFLRDRDGSIAWLQVMVRINARLL